MQEAQAGAAPRAVAAALHHDGYRGGFRVDGDGALCCPVCGTCQPPQRASLDRVQPARDAVVLAVRCPACGERGIAVVGSGGDAPPGDVVLRGALPDPGEAPLLSAGNSCVVK